MSQAILTDFAITVAAPAMVGITNPIGIDQRAMMVALDNTNGTGTVAFMEGSPDPGATTPTWFSLPAYRAQNWTPDVDGGTGFAVTDAAKRAWIVPLCGMSAFRLRLSALTGTAVASLRSLDTLALQQVLLPIAQANTVDYVTMLTNLGLRAAGGTAPATFPGVVAGVGLVNTGINTTSIGASTAAAGTTTADAGVLPAGTAEVYPTTAADDTVGVRIHASDAVTGRKLFIGNGVSNKILKVYAPTGGTINGAAANAAYSSASGKGVTIVCLSGAGNTWLAAG